MWIFQRSLYGLLVLIASGCATEVSPLVDQDQIRGSLVVGRAVTVVIGERSRRYLPQVRFLEVEDQESKKRFQLRTDSPDQRFAMDLPPGRYRLMRVQISEGPFMSMADLDMAFLVEAVAVTHVGTWRFGVGTTGYGRTVMVSMTVDQEENDGMRGFLGEQYPRFRGAAAVESLPKPSQVEARLYEVMPYPRYPRYFRRHWW